MKPEIEIKTESVSFVKVVNGKVTTPPPGYYNCPGKEKLNIEKPKNLNLLGKVGFI